MPADPLTPLLASVLEEYVRRRREEERLAALVLTGFEPAKSAKVKRSEVYRYVAERLGRPVSNELSVAVRDAVCRLPGVMLSVSDGRARFLGLRRRPTE